MQGYLTAADIADRLGVRLQTVHRYHTRGDLPPADETVGRTPLWREETITAWLEGRRGHGWRKGQRRAG